MAVQLVKRGNRVNLTKDNPGLKKVNLCLGWDAARFDTSGTFDLDASVAVLDANDKCKDDGDFIFYGNPNHPSGAVHHSGDERTGAASGDDEVISVDFSKVPDYAQKIALVITFYQEPNDTRDLNFGMVDNAYLRVDNAETQAPVIKFDLTESYSSAKALLVAELYRSGSEWKFAAIGQGYNAGLDKFVRDWGLQVG